MVKGLGRRGRRNNGSGEEAAHQAEVAGGLIAFISQGKAAGGYHKGNRQAAITREIGRRLSQGKSAGGISQGKAAVGRKAREEGNSSGSRTDVVERLRKPVSECGKRGTQPVRKAERCKTKPDRPGRKR